MIRKRCRSVGALFLIVLLGVTQWMVGVASAEDLPLLDELCSPAYEGRRVGTEGNQLAAQRLADKLEAYSLIPLEGYSEFFIPFEQGIAVIEETMLTAVMEDGSRVDLVYGQDYMFAGTASQIHGIYTVSLDVESADSSAVLFVDPSETSSTPSSDAFAAMVLPVDALSYNNLGINTHNIQGTLPRINMIRTVYDRIKSAAMLDIQYTFSETTVTASNVVGAIPGKDRTKAVVISAHFDGVGDQAGNRLPCALDNASGVAAVELVMSQMAGTEPPYDVIIAFTNAEESRLTGAYDLAGRLTYQYDDLYNINVDCVGIEGLSFPMQSTSENSEVLYQMMEEKLSANGFATSQEVYGSSDYVAFQQSGIPSVCLGTPVIGVIHTVNDTQDRIDTDVIRGIAEVIVDFIVENPDIHSVLTDNHDSDAAITVTPSLAYNEAMRQEDTLYMGSTRWMTLDEALRYHPSLPILEAYKGCPIEACMVMLSTTNIPDSDPGEVMTIPVDPQNISEIRAIYSDGITGFQFQFNTMNVLDMYERKQIGDEGFLLTMQEGNMDVVMGIGLQKGDMSLYLFDGDSSQLLEIESGLFVHMREYGTSKVTEENASVLLTDSELTEFFEAIIDFVQP